MTALAEQHSRFLEAFQQLRPQLGDGQWLGPIRQAAIERFGELGFPTTDHEDWRFTNVAPIAGTAFVPAAEASRTPMLEDVKSYTFGETRRLVFVNGRFCPELSLTAALKGLKIRALADALHTKSDVVAQHLAKHAPYADNAFVALNTALMQDGAVVEVVAGAVLDAPIHVLYLTVPHSEPIVTHPRTLIVAEDGAQLSVVETYASLGSGTYFTNPVTEIVAGRNANVRYYRVQRESEQAYHVGMLHVHQDRDSFVACESVDFGAALARIDTHAMLAGEGAEGSLGGLYMVHGQQHVDNHLRVEHVAPHCDSREYYKGILDDKAKGVFTGRIVVHKGAQKTDAKQTNMNLLLSEGAQIDTKPQLEIFADDVKCTHGATIGQIDADALFYLRARGIGEQDARSLMIYAFASESLNQIKIEPLRKELESLLLERLPGGERLKEAL